VFRLVGHLVYWGKATIIYPLCETNVYRISPTAVLDSSDLHENFAQNFPNNPCLFSSLSEFSAPTSLADFTNPLTFDPQEQAERVRIVVWLLKNFMLIQLRTYVYLSIDKSPSDLSSFLISRKEYDSNENFQSMSVHDDYKLIRNLLSKHLNTSETDHFLNLYARQIGENRSFYDDVRLFCKLIKYFNGQHHLEDIMFRENLRRHELMRILTEFNAVLITCSYEDELSAIFIEQ
uniref:GATOR complex protein NPRL3 n=1 Tax=Romanomermis culicivorax TaxID=13658 RepID=A0A915KEH0_ROMCU